MSTSSLPSFIKIHPAVLEKKSKMWKVYGRTDDGRCAMTIAHSSLRLRWAKKKKNLQEHPWIMGNMPVKFRDHGCKGIAVMCRKPFPKSMHYNLDLWTFDPEINRAHPWLMESLPVKFRNHRYKAGLETYTCKLAKCESKFSFASWKYWHSKKVASSIFWNKRQ